MGKKNSTLTRVQPLFKFINKDEEKLNQLFQYLHKVEKEFNSFQTDISSYFSSFSRHGTILGFCCFRFRIGLIEMRLTDFKRNY